MTNQLIEIIMYVVMFFVYMVVLWRISIWQKLKKQDFTTALVISAILTTISLILMVPYLLGVVFPIVVRIVISILIFILTIFLIKKFYQTDWWKAIKIYLLVILFAFLTMAVGTFLIVILIMFFGLIFKYF